MRISRRILRIVALILALIITNGALSFLLEPYRSSSGEMWQGYAAQENIDTVFVGTSQCLQGIDPDALDPVLGSNSYNMATNMQSPADSLIAVRTAIEDHGVSRVVLAIDHEILSTARSENFRAEASFVRGKVQAEGSLEAAGDIWAFVTSRDFIGKPISLLYFTPWVYNRSTDIASNVRERLAGEVLDSTGHRTAKGYEPSDEVLDESLPPFTTIEQAGQWDLENPDLDVPYLTEDNREILTQIIDLCADNDVSLTAIIIPYANWLDIYNAQGYLALRDELASLFASGGASFYDFNLIRQEQYAKSRSDFRDVGHMNRQGAVRFSAYLGAFLQEKEAGTDVDTWFLMTDEIDLTPRGNSKNEDPSAGL